MTDQILNENVLITDIGGIGIRLTNKTGAASVKGTLVRVYDDTAIEEAFEVAAAGRCYQRCPVWGYCWSFGRSLSRDWACFGIEDSGNECASENRYALQLTKEKENGTEDF